MGFVLYNNRFYYTNSATKTSKNEPDWKNTFCVDAQTGNMVWGSIAPWSESLGTNPIVKDGRVYVSQGIGLRVYDAGTGKLVGVDTSICGHGLGANALYNNYMITFNTNSDTGMASVIAVDVGK
jgi:outer membrane protein assembly factor BamB